MAIPVPLTPLPSHACSLLWLIATLVLRTSVADEGSLPLNPDQAQAIYRLDAQVDEIEAAQASLEEQILQSRRSATDVDRKWQALQSELAQLKSRQQEVEQQLKAQQESVRLATAKHEQAMAATVAAQQQVEEVKLRLANAQTQAASASAEADAATKPLAEMQVQLAALAPKVLPLSTALAEVESHHKVLHRSIESLAGRAAELASKRSEYEKQIESTLRASGKWISFTDQIAPIFHRHCVACHNVRNAHGRYNMATFGAIHSPGESGQAIVAGMSQESRLFQLIEEGSMPNDADPLAEDQIALIRQWIDLGARIDWGADTAAPLLRLMPRVKQPLPPSQYQVAPPVTALALHPAGGPMASSGYHEVLLWSLSTAGITGRISNVAERVHGLAYHPDGHHLAVASGTPGRWGEVKVFEVSSGRLVADLWVSEDSIFDVSYSPDGSRLAACGADGTIAIFSPDDPEARPQIITDHSDWVNAIDWSPDGKRLVSASRDKTAKVFDVETSKRLITFSGHAQTVTDVKFLQDGKRLVSSGEDHRILVWDAADAKQQRAIAGFTDEINRIELLGDERLLSISSSNQLRVHQLADGSLLHELTIPGDGAASVVLADDQKTVMVGDQTGQLHRIEMDEQPTLKQSWQATP